MPTCSCVIIRPCKEPRYVLLKIHCFKINIDRRVDTEFVKLQSHNFPLYSVN